MFHYTPGMPLIFWNSLPLQFHPLEIVEKLLKYEYLENFRKFKICCELRETLGLISYLQQFFYEKIGYFQQPCYCLHPMELGEKLMHKVSEGFCKLSNSQNTDERDHVHMCVCVYSIYIYIYPEKRIA